MVAAAISGLAADLAGHAGLVSLSGTSLVASLSVGLIATGRVRGATAKACVGLAGTFGAVLTVRSNPWAIVPAMAAALVLLLIGASIGADATGVPRTPRAALLRTVTSAGHLTIGPGILRPLAGPGTDRTGRPTARLVRLARGSLLAVAVTAPLAALLASADPIFRSWLNLPAAAHHLLLAAGGAWTLLGIVRAASATRPPTTTTSRCPVRRTDAVCALAGTATVYTAFVAAQLVAVSGGARHVLTTQGVTYAQYARSGFFQLLVCATLTLIVVLVARSVRNDHDPLIQGLCGLVAVLTLGVVAAAIARLRLYQTAYGLTLLRLAALAASGWIGAMFVLVALVSFVRPVRPAGPYAAFAITLIAISSWALINPAAIVARTNLDRAAAGHPLDTSALAALGPDAIPTIVNSLPRLPDPDRQSALDTICRLAPSASGSLSYNAARRTAAKTAADACSKR